MQKGMPNYYEYNGQKYSVCFPVEWATTHIEGTGPMECHICNAYGSDNGIFKKYCEYCISQYCDKYRNTGEVCKSYSLSVYDISDDDDDDDDDISIISDDTDSSGIGCNRCYNCVTGGTRPCVLNRAVLYTDREEVDTIINDSSTDITLDLQSNDGFTHDISQYAVKPLFDVAAYNAAEDVFAEINHYNENTRISYYDEEQEFGLV
jgi:hypothetical protein